VSADMSRASEIGPRHLGPGANLAARSAGVFGLVLLLMGVGATMFKEEGGWRHFQHSLLIGATFVTSIGVGALFFVLIQHLTGSSWSVVVRRVAERLTGMIWIGAVLFAPLIVLTLMGRSDLYPWVDVDSLGETKDLVAKKTPYLNSEFFSLRMLVYFLIWMLMSWRLNALSLAQDQDGEQSRTRALRRFAAPAMLVFAITTTFFAFDALMSLDPAWFSTIFGVYFFAGAVVCMLAVLILLTMMLESGPLRGLVTLDHYHDLGKLLFAFVFFWGYIAFSQYMLIWYANIPEETLWYIHRQEHGWEYVSLLLLFGHLLIPFAGLISRNAKRSRTVLGGWAAFLIAMHLVDLYYIVGPALDHHRVPISMIDVLVCAGVAFLAFSVFLMRFKRHSVLPHKDPLLQASLDFVNV
jgi:hypothetical protein